MMGKKSTTFRPSQLTEVEMEDARNLQRRFADYKAKGGTQAGFAKEFDFPGGPTMITQNIKGNRPISIEQAKSYMRGFQCSLEEISKSLAMKTAELADSDPANEVGSSKGPANLLSRYKASDPKVQATVDDLTTLPPDEALKLATLIQSIRATYAPKT